MDQVRRKVAHTKVTDAHAMPLAIGLIQVGICRCRGVTAERWRVVGKGGRKECQSNLALGLKDTEGCVVVPSCSCCGVSHLAVTAVLQGCYNLAASVQ